MSDNIISSLLELSTKYSFPPIFTATRNQIDWKECGNSYVMDTSNFIRYINFKKKQLDLKKVFICRDHLGSKLKDYPNNNEHSNVHIIKCLFKDINAGFDCIHLDTTKAKNKKEQLEEMIKFRKLLPNQKMNSVPSFEVSYDSNESALSDPNKFEIYISELNQKFKTFDFSLPLFIVGQLGTHVSVNGNDNFFDVNNCREISKICQAYGIRLKEHNADFLGKYLANHRKAGVEAFNIGPELSLTENKVFFTHLKDYFPKYASKLGKKVLLLKNTKKWLSKNNKKTDNLEKIKLFSLHYLQKSRLYNEAKMHLKIKMMKNGVDLDNEIQGGIKSILKKHIKYLNLKNSWH